MKSDCGIGGGGIFYSDGTRRHFNYGCETNCFNCGCCYYGGAYYLCEDCEEVKLTKICQEAIKKHLRKWGIPRPPYPIPKSVIKIMEGMAMK